VSDPLHTLRSSASDARVYRDPKFVDALYGQTVRTLLNVVLLSVEYVTSLMTLMMMMMMMMMMKLVQA